MIKKKLIKKLNLFNLNNFFFRLRRMIPKPWLNHSLHYNSQHLSKGLQCSKMFACTSAEEDRTPCKLQSCKSFVSRVKGLLHKDFMFPIQNNLKMSCQERILQSFEHTHRRYISLSVPICLNLCMRVYVQTHNMHTGRAVQLLLWKISHAFCFSVWFHSSSHPWNCKE